MKKKLALFLAFIMLLGLMPTNVFAANTAKSEPASDKAYEEVRIDGAPYKVYKVADFIDGHSEESAISLMSRSAKPFGNPATTGTSNIKFVLNLKWSTIDRPIETIKLPVYVGPPNDSRSFTLGYFEVESYASPGVEQRFDMVKTYTGTDIEDLVKYAFSQITIAIPVDMRYDFILASAKWDSKKKPVNNEFVFTIEGRQSVMHGYGIRWFDTVQDNREKVVAKWEGKENQTSDVKLGTEDRDYSVYKNNVIDTNDNTNIKTYPDGTQYSNYDYYYNGKKITTYADADNLGKYDDEVLGIAELRQAPTASLKVKDGNDYKLKGTKTLKNNTKYFYNSVGDYRTFHVLSMREAVNVKFNTGLGFLNDTDKTAGKKEQPIKVSVKGEEKESQEIGYGEKLAGNESGNVVIIPDGKKLIPPTKIKNVEGTYEFKGWTLEADMSKTYDELKNGNKLIYPDEGNTEKDEKLKPLKTALTASEQALKTKKNEFDSAYNEAADKCSVYLKSEDAIREAKKKDPNADVSKLEEAKTKAKAEYDKVKKIWDEKKAAYNEAKKDYDEKLAALEKEAKDTISYQVLNKKETTFYAVFGPKDQGKVNVKYVDESDNPISQDPNTKDYRFISDKTGEDVDKKGNKLTLDTKYPDKKEGNVGETIKTDDLKGPTFIGYKFKQVKTDPIPDPSATATYTKEGTYTIKFVYEKLPDIIPEKTDNGTDNPKVTPDIKETYVKVTFTNGVENKKFGKLYLGNTEPTEQDKLIESVSYYVNPREKKTIENVKANENVNVKVIDASKKVHETTPWIDNNSNEIKLTKEITDADKKDGITVNANYDDKGNGVAAIRYAITFVIIICIYSDSVFLICVSNFFS